MVSPPLEAVRVALAAAAQTIRSNQDPRQGSAGTTILQLQKCPPLGRKTCRASTNRKVNSK